MIRRSLCFEAGEKLCCYKLVLASVFVHRLCALSRLRDGCLTTARRLYPVMADLMCVNIVDSTTELVKR